MSASLILLHEEALRVTHPIFNAAHTDTKAIYVWDDGYFRQANYSLKRLIFIYETLCELPVDIIHGDMFDSVQQLAPSTLYIPATNNPLIIETINALKVIAPVQIIEDEPFAAIGKPTDFLRFFQYWNEVERTVFLRNGVSDA